MKKRYQGSSLSEIDLLSLRRGLEPDERKDYWEGLVYMIMFRRKEWPSLLWENYYDRKPKWIG